MACRFPRAVRNTVLAALAFGVLTGGADAKIFRWANDGDSNSMDPYARQETFLLLFDQSMYEPLIRRDRQMKLEPGLATEWARTAPDVWRFTLRPGMRSPSPVLRNTERTSPSMSRPHRLARLYPGSSAAAPERCTANVSRLMALAKKPKSIDNAFNAG